MIVLAVLTADMLGMNIIDKFVTEWELFPVEFEIAVTVAAVPESLVAECSVR